MANNDIIVSEMTPASQINTGDLMIMTQPDAQSETGYSTKSGTVLQVSNKMLKGTNYETDLPSFTNKNVLGGMEELKGDIFNLLPVDEASGSIANFETELAAPLQSVLVNVVASGGNGTPDNPNPIVGYSSANITRCGVNLLGGEDFADLIVAKVPNAVKDTANKTITYEGQYIIRIALFDKFKPNTQYTFFIKRASGVANMKIKYTDGTETQITTFPQTSANNKSILNLSGEWQSGTSVVSYDECGIFEGIKTVDDFEPYNGQTYAIAFGQTVYGVVLDVTRGKLHVTWEGSNLGSLIWAGSNGRFYSTSLNSTIKKGSVGDFDHLLCSIFKGVNTGSLSNLNNYEMSVDTGGNIQIRDDDYTSASDFKTAMNGILLAYELATPFDIDLTPVQIRALVGENNVFADCGGIDVRFKDTIQHYIDKKIAQTQALIL